MTKNEILDYIMSTPENTNRQVLQYLLDDISGGGGNIPLPEYECDFVNFTEDDGLIINLDLDDITEDDVLVTVHLEEEEEENSNLYLILDLSTGTGIAMEADDIIGFISDFDTMENNNTYCIMAAWPPQSQPQPQPQPQYDTWDYSIDKQYEAYSYQYEGETLNGFITNSAYPAFGSDHNMNLLSFVNIQHADEYHPDFTLSAQIDGVIVDNEFIPINEFYVDWNIGDINKSQSYRYVFSFNGTTTTTTGTVKLTWYGAELRQQK